QTVFEAIMEACRAYAPGARLDGVLVQPMARPGTEIILGATRDPVFGAVVTVGIGGVHVELLRDVVHRIAPVGPEEAAAMLRELRLSRLLDGIRGEPARDTAALCDAIWRFSLLAADLVAEFAEIDVNPLILHAAGEGATIVDALIVRPRATTRDAIAGGPG
ncbi:MAG: acetate--CoA ligase family protein, partial [Acetobacteraceae bacterium]